MKSVTIIGAGRIGIMLSQAQQFADYTVRLLRRGEVNLLPEGPIILCTRNDDLDTIMSWIPPMRFNDLVFVQNGMLQSWFETHGLDNVTTALLYVAVSTVGATPVDGARSVVTGPRAAEFQTLMRDLGLHCMQITKPQFQVEMVEKFLWNCIFGLLCEVHQTTVGNIVTSHASDLTNLTRELLSVCEQRLGFALSEADTWNLLQRLSDYSMSIAAYQGAVKEWSWRNGWLVDTGLPQPLHLAHLKNVVPHLL